MLANININALNNVPVNGAIANPHLFVGEYNVFDDPVIREFNEWTKNIFTLVQKIAIVAVIYLAYAYLIYLSGLFLIFIWFKTREWITHIFITLSVILFAYFIKSIYDEREDTEIYMEKLKAKIDAKDALIAKLEKQITLLKDLSDSDYDPELDEY